jgi:hypothetical protein
MQASVSHSKERLQFIHNSFLFSNKAALMAKLNDASYEDYSFHNLIRR